MTRNLKPTNKKINACREAFQEKFQENISTQRIEEILTTARKIPLGNFIIQMVQIIRENPYNRNPLEEGTISSVYSNSDGCNCIIGKYLIESGVLFPVEVGYLKNSNARSILLKLNFISSITEMAHSVQLAADKFISLTDERESPLVPVQWGQLDVDRILQISSPKIKKVLAKTKKRIRPADVTLTEFQTTIKQIAKNNPNSMNPTDRYGRCVYYKNYLGGHSSYSIIGKYLIDGEFLTLEELSTYTLDVGSLFNSMGFIKEVAEEAEEVERKVTSDSYYALDTWKCSIDRYFENT